MHAADLLPPTLTHAACLPCSCLLPQMVFAMKQHGRRNGLWRYGKSYWNRVRARAGAMHDAPCCQRQSARPLPPPSPAHRCIMHACTYLKHEQILGPSQSASQSEGRSGS